MKKVILSLAVLATVALVSCGKGGNNDSESLAKAEAANTEAVQENTQAVDAATDAIQEATPATDEAAAPAAEEAAPATEATPA